MVSITEKCLINLFVSAYCRNGCIVTRKAAEASLSFLSPISFVQSCIPFTEFHFNGVYVILCITGSLTCQNNNYDYCRNKSIE